MSIYWLIVVFSILVGCTGCVSVIEPSPKVKVAHSPLPDVSNRAEGVVVLREEIDSYQKQRRLVGGQVLSTKDAILLFIPTAHPRLCFEIEGRQSSNQVLTGFLAETLEQAGYTVRVQAKPTKAVPKKWREVRCIVEFAVVEFNYEYRDTGARPNSHTITLDLRLLEQPSLTTLWQKRYHALVQTERRDTERTIQEALDVVLGQILQDAVSGELRAKITSDGKSSARVCMLRGAS